MLTRSRSFRTPHEVSLRLTLAPLRRGRTDPTMTIDPIGAVWRATRTPAGPATTRLHVRPSTGEVVVDAWGPGADWACDAAPALVGCGDDRVGFDADAHPLIGELHRRMPGLRIPRSQAIWEAVLPSICEQKVTGIQAKRSIRGMVWRWGERAPFVAGGPSLRLYPDAAKVAAQPGYAFHPFGLELKRADTLRRAAAAAPRLDDAVDLHPSEVRALLEALPGIGPWTSAEVAIVALGDADAVSVGDYHLPNLVSWNLAGEPRADDDRMLELLEPWMGHRGRVLRLLAHGGEGAPKYGPRMTIRDISAQ